uniref:Uncharacterized protein n=1 Tax=Rhodococcus sp. NS1 TaxID=402236 RepID=A0A097SPS7_9NOCA|nr:hypothetical protein LRS1606.96 [Rhodococcus sp. NS1]
MDRSREVHPIRSNTIHESHRSRRRHRSCQPAAGWPTQTLTDDSHPAIAHLGPALFTKYLYFAGAAAPDHPSLILDSCVAVALVDIGWISLHPETGWPAETYQWYCSLLARWAQEAGNLRPDLFERWLFDHSSSS